jgi:starvation-inducible DNA-binding protein
LGDGILPQGDHAHEILPKIAAQKQLSAPEAEPLLDFDKGQETPPWGTLTDLPISLGEETWMQSIEALNQLLSDTITLRDMSRSIIGR